MADHGGDTRSDAGYYAATLSETEFALGVFELETLWPPLKVLFLNAYLNFSETQTGNDLQQFEVLNGFNSCLLGSLIH